MSPLALSILISSLSTGTIITMSSYHWLFAWFGLEMNTLAVIPLISKPHHPRATEAATKYFLTQAAAAAMILFASTLNAWSSGQWTILHPTTQPAALMMLIALAMKLGLAPMHFWYPEVLQGSSLPTALLMSTWQKLAPLALLLMMLNHLPQTALFTLGLLSAYIGGWAGINQTQTRKIMAFSSIAHMGWLLIALTLSYNLTALTLLIYLTMTSAMFLALIPSTTKTITDVGTTWTQNPTLLTLTMITLMSLGGLPPLTGFMPKWLIIKELTTLQLSPLAAALAMASLPSLFFYIRMAYFTTLTTPPTTTTTEQKWRHTQPTPPSLSLTTTMTMLALPMTSLLHHSL
uniref:NADH-ubiquinone oxidoreductase chain 2 n=1 Tax=Teratoscincus microlepis TaxID=102173 RepID=Q9TFV3_9SAUR|nr:NADH dehydrogenase subunit 2 [Teratoscincus microlepis]AFP67687.1 NADH dehydrogenase subunit 2 [Teratoscincus microlepis]ANC96262.1 NADH dehydrogenase subunit 2 [Teratoscincus microlepis]